MQLAAAQLGWTFSAEAPWNYIPGLDRFELFSQGHSKEIKNMMYGEAGGNQGRAIRLHLRNRLWQEQCDARSISRVSRAGEFKSAEFFAAAGRHHV